MKTYVITVSEKFPTKHKRKGEPTFFRENILAVKKIHTIRNNYEFWKKRIDEVQNGKAVLSIRVWTGKPYASPQEEITYLTDEDGVSIQKLTPVELGYYLDGIYYDEPIERFANNDGLNEQDFTEWFKDIQPNNDMAIIHFTNFKY